MNNSNNTWLAYEAGKDYKRRIGLYETIRRNRQFYHGEQWDGPAGELPRPVFNLVRRITDFLVGSLASESRVIHFTDRRLPFVDRSELRRKISESIDIFNRHLSYRWQESRMDSKVYTALLDAALSGNGVFYCWWDAEMKNGQLFTGDIRTDCIGIESLFVADVNCADLQQQDYVILSGRATVDSLRREALANGVSPDDAAKIIGDGEGDTDVGGLSAIDQQGSEKATYLIRFFRENGEVIFEKSTRTCLLRRVNTGLKLYPVAHFHWFDRNNSYIGSAPVSDMIANQRYVNTAYAMMMKHMTDTAFSKVIYDKSRIPEWSNEVGQAIAAMGGGNVSDAVSVVGVGKMEEGYLDLISNVIETTKNMMGATDAALGEADAHNTSAILALQEISRIVLDRISVNLNTCIADLAEIWADMLCTYSDPSRLLPATANGEQVALAPQYELLRGELLKASVQVGITSRYTPSSTVALLDKLLDKGLLDAKEYLELLPNGAVSDREKIMEKIKKKGMSSNE